MFTTYYLQVPGTAVARQPRRRLRRRRYGHMRPRLGSIGCPSAGVGGRRAKGCVSLLVRARAMFGVGLGCRVRATPPAGARCPPYLLLLAIDGRLTDLPSC